MLAQSIDLSDPILGFTHRWIEKLAERVERLYCIGLKVGDHSLSRHGIEVYSMGKERGFRFVPDLRYLMNLYRTLGEIERDGGVDIVFTHMAPVFAVASAPYTYLKGLPLVHWYAHPAVDWRLKVAHNLCTRMVTSLSTAYRYKHDKVTILGQGIATDLFLPGEATGETQDVPLVLCVGRISPAKDLPTLLRATANLKKRLSRPFRVAVVGGSPGGEGEAYLNSLRKLGGQLGLEDFISFEGPVAYGEELVNWYRKCAVHVNLTPVGFGDKVALEAMSCGKLNLLCNDGYEETLGEVAGKLLFRPGDHEDLARKLHWALSLSPEERDRIGLYLRGRVIQMHSLDRLMDRLVECFNDLIANL